MIRSLQEQVGGVVLIEVDTMTEARDFLESLPAIAAGLVEFELLPIGPFLGFEYLFKEAHLSTLAKSG